MNVFFKMSYDQNSNIKYLTWHTGVHHVIKSGIQKGGGENDGIYINKKKKNFSN